MLEFICGLITFIIFIFFLVFAPKKNSKINQYEDEKMKQFQEKRRIRLLNYYNKIDRLNISDSNKIIFKGYIKWISYFADSTMKQSYAVVATFLKRTGIEATKVDWRIIQNYLKEYNFSYNTSHNYRFHICKFWSYAVKDLPRKNR